MSQFIPDDETVAELLENSDIEVDVGVISWDPDAFDLYPDQPNINFTDEPTIEHTENWTKKAFTTKNITENLPTPIENTKTPSEYFSKYFPDHLFEEIAVNTKKSLVSRGKHANYCDTNCIRQFFGVHVLMGVVRCPQKQLYFHPTFQYGPISNTLTYEKFRQIRLSLSAVDVNFPDEIDQITSHLWRVQPVLEAVRTRCQQLPRQSSHYSIGEQLINFVGPQLGTMFNWNKHALGLKNFIVTDPQGLVVDFEIFQGFHTDFPDHPLGTRTSIILRLARTLPNACLYFGPDFTTVSLMMELTKVGINGTGLLMPCRWKRELYEFPKDRQLEPGDTVEIVTEDGKICAIKWMENKKSVMILSNVYGTVPTKSVEKFDESLREYHTVSCPIAVSNYKRNILGIGLAKQIMDLYSTSFKSSKWPVNLILYLFDLAVTNSYFEYRDEAKRCRKNCSESFDAVAFRLKIVEGLLGNALKKVKVRHSAEDITEIAPEATDVSTPLYRPPSLASIEDRFDGKDHWLICDKSIKSQRFCRRERCKSRTNMMCSKCKIYLCFNYHKNCFYTFHNRLDKKPD